MSTQHAPSLAPPQACRSGPLAAGARGDRSGGGTSRRGCGRSARAASGKWWCRQQQQQHDNAPPQAPVNHRRRCCGGSAATQPAGRHRRWKHRQRGTHHEVDAGSRDREPCVNEAVQVAAVREPGGAHRAVGVVCSNGRPCRWLCDVCTVKSVGRRQRVTRGTRRRTWCIAADDLDALFVAGELRLQAVQVEGVDCSRRVECWRR